MNEAEVKDWLRRRFDVSRETIETLDRFVALLLEENRKQNLIASSTVGDVWDRHVRDSAQLLSLAPSERRGAEMRGAEMKGGAWIDLGSGPGLPGVVLAILGDMRITLVEERTRRVDFLLRTIDRLGLADHVSVEGCKLQRLDTAIFDVIVARAFTALPKLLMLAHRFSRPDTLWLLPKGKSAQEELEEARRTWQGDFALTSSLTSDEAFIVTARNVRPRRGS
ncbi:MAG: 16S rRNA (guanine(527)-N(7))-methyltransferase RsmG [Pseudomonadota bacterium]